jgi:hypothetical protein
MATIISVSTETELRAALLQASNDVSSDGDADGGPYTINLPADITLTQSLPMIRGIVPGDGSTAITIDGNGHTLDADDKGRVFFVESGRVVIEDITIANAKARAGDGGTGTGGGGGGGLGAGAALLRRHRRRGDHQGRDDRRCERGRRHGRQWHRRR